MSASWETGLHPELIRKIKIVLAAMATLGFPMKVVQGLRSAEEQNLLYKQGRTSPGKIVTNCDGVATKSNHQMKSDGYGHAVDCAAQGAEPFAETFPWKAYGECAKALGLRWGGDWKGSLVDRPHVELA
jgi:peptidoglycan L-alanyl-D-glutamate endopeptidase CwlK